MIIQDLIFDMDGGAIVIENGYLDDPNKEGLSVFATSLLSYMAFNCELYNIESLENYFGNFKYRTKEHFINFRFYILNNGFHKILC